ncbi:MAG: GIY-YIG nuclease family protein [Elusimicrobia bacterium]|nr:GIY-YIG nuclease family protein [Elusimicrobiota bacterium]
MPCVYILYSKKAARFYTGSSRADNAETRLAAHNSGRTRSTKSGRPWEMVYAERVPDYTEARKRENFLKSGDGRKQVFKILANCKK